MRKIFDQNQMHSCPKNLRNIKNSTKSIFSETLLSWYFSKHRVLKKRKLEELIILQGLLNMQKYSRLSYNAHKHRTA